MEEAIIYLVRGTRSGKFEKLEVVVWPNREKIRVYKWKQGSPLHDFNVEINVVNAFAAPLLGWKRENKTDAQWSIRIRWWIGDNKTSEATIKYRSTALGFRKRVSGNYFSDLWKRVLYRFEVFNLRSFHVGEIMRSLKMIEHPRERIFTRIFLLLFFLILYPKRGSPFPFFYNSCRCSRTCSRRNLFDRKEFR